MYTVLWIDSNGSDKWERFAHRADVVDFLKTFGLSNDEDVTIIESDIANDEYTASDFLNS